MACVSFNKVRLQYYVSKNKRSAIWLSYLLNNPVKLFATTLIMINACLQVGSELARHFYLAIGLSADWAPLSQVILVLIFAEISPMFAGRRYAENVAMNCVPIVYVSSIILSPITTLFDYVCRFINKIIGSPSQTASFFSREELQKIIEERGGTSSDSQEFNKIVSNIFTFKNRTPKDLMIPLSRVQMLPSFCTAQSMKNLLAKHYTPYLPIYHSSPDNIIGIAYPRDFLRSKEDCLVKEKAKSPWFITQHACILQILNQFQTNNQSLAVVLNEGGQAVGILTLDVIIDEMMGRSDTWDVLSDQTFGFTTDVVVDRSFPSDALVTDLNKQFRLNLNTTKAHTLNDLFIQEIGHSPVKGESIQIGELEMVVKEVSLLGPKTISIKTLTKK